MVVTTPQWLATLQARIHQPPLTPRVPLLTGGLVIGSVDAQAFAALVLTAGLQNVVQWHGDHAVAESGWVLVGAASPSLARLAEAMREHGYARVAHLWRDELLAVRSEAGQQMAVVERGAVRALGIATHGVHLTGVTEDRYTWIQQRAIDKKTDPGRWDTLMGGMVSAADSLQQALARETMEEAGLTLAQLHALRHAGHFTMRLPNAPDSGLEYVIERIDWFECTVPNGAVPNNTDGEVQQFKRVSQTELNRMLVDGAFTTEAGLILGTRSA
jgi:8-oxo-dGTP pyrophosphatase MutT (NUDIX family)